MSKTRKKTSRRKPTVVRRRPVGMHVSAKWSGGPHKNVYIIYEVSFSDGSTRYENGQSLFENGRSASDRAPFDSDMTSVAGAMVSAMVELHDVLQMACLDLDKGIHPLK